MEIDGLDDDEDHGPTFEANFFFSKKTPEGARKCKVMFCFASGCFGGVFFCVADFWNQVPVIRLDSWFSPCS